MKFVFKMLLVGLMSSVVVGCASLSDVDNLQAQITSLKTSVTQASADAKSAQASADEALSASRAAESAANRAAQYAQDTNSKLDSLFRKAMVK